LAIVRVQGNARGCVVGGSNFTITMGSTPISGNVLILAIGIRCGTSLYITVSSISQTGVTWSLVIQKKAVPSLYYMDTEIWIGIVGTGAGTVITVTLTGTLPTNGEAVADVCEYSGVLTVGYLDKTATNSGANSTPDTGTTATTTQADELWIGSTSAEGADQTTPRNGFTLLDGVQLCGFDEYNSEAYLEKIVSATGTANSGTTCPYNTDWVGCIATFKASPAAKPKGSITLLAKGGGII